MSAFHLYEKCLKKNDLQINLKTDIYVNNYIKLNGRSLTRDHVKKFIYSVIKNRIYKII